MTLPIMVIIVRIPYGVFSNRRNCIWNTFSFGSEVVFASASRIAVIGATFDSTNNKVVIAYRSGGNSNNGTAKVGTVSGTSISFGSATVFNTGSPSQISVVYDSTNQKVVIAYLDGGTSTL